MQPKPQISDQGDLFRSRLDQMLDRQHELYRLADQIDWSFFEREFGPLYSVKMGRPGVPIRLLVGLHYLKHAFIESDESVVARFVENPYWQHFCGFEFFQHRLPLDPTTLWSNGESGSVSKEWRSSCRQPLQPPCAESTLGRSPLSEST